jgi:hypothetical protein
MVLFPLLMAYYYFVASDFPPHALGPLLIPGYGEFEDGVGNDNGGGGGSSGGGGGDGDDGSSSASSSSSSSSSSVGLPCCMQLLDCVATYGDGKSDTWGGGGSSSSSSSSMFPAVPASEYGNAFYCSGAGDDVTSVRSNLVLNSCSDMAAAAVRFFEVGADGDDDIGDDGF